MKQVIRKGLKNIIVDEVPRSARWRMWPDKGYAAQMGDFAESIRQGRLPAVTAYDGARATLGCLAMMASARDGAPPAQFGKLRAGCLPALRAGCQPAAG